MSAKVAFLGLGVMGFPMAGHLKAKGYDVTVYNRTAAKIGSLGDRSTAANPPPRRRRPRRVPTSWPCA